MLIIADGATSKLATAMGYCTEAPKGVCSRAYVEGGTHNTKFDGTHPGSAFLGRLEVPLHRSDRKHLPVVVACLGL